MCQHLACGSYREVQRDPMNKVINKVCMGMKNSSLDDNKKKTLIPSNAIISCIYGLPKIHNSDIPLSRKNTWQGSSDLS